MTRIPNEPTLRWLPRVAQRVVPWRNGGGSTREVAVAAAEPGSGQPFRWRVSIATVAADGPFSEFPGVDRLLWLLTGDGLALDVDGLPVRLVTPLECLAFAGEVPVTARLLGGPTQDLNVMLDRERVVAEPRVVRLGPGEALICTQADAGDDVLVALRGGLRVAAPDGVARELAEGDAVRLDGGRAGRAWHLAGGPADALLVAFRPRR